ncbi:MAG: hypothetical protein R2693_08500 [Nocardioidaceae bacterium]
MINLETPKKVRPLLDQAHQVAMNILRPISRKYDEAEHTYPKELDMLAAMIDGLDESGASQGAGASAYNARRARQMTARIEMAQTWPASISRCAGRRGVDLVDASSGTWQLSHRSGCQPRAEGTLRQNLGRHGDHRAWYRI